MTGNEPDGRLMDHDYDGIQEYDNPLPRWWNWIFVATIAFSALYIGYYQLGAGPTIQEKYQAQVAAHIERLLSKLGELKPDNETILRFMRNEDWMAAMKGVFAGNCAQCHAADGGGNIGPNLTDDFYKNVTAPADIFRTISEGVPGTGMPTWKERFREPQIILLASYVASLRGTTPVKPKAPEGKRVPPWSSFEEPAAGGEADAPAGAGAGAGGDGGGGVGGGTQ